MRGLAAARDRCRRRHGRGHARVYCVPTGCHELSKVLGRELEDVLWLVADHLLGIRLEDVAEVRRDYYLFRAVDRVAVERHRPRQQQQQQQQAVRKLLQHGG